MLLLGLIEPLANSLKAPEGDHANLLLSSGKDNRTIVWDPNTSEMLCELPASARWTFDVQVR